MENQHGVDNSNALNYLKEDIQVCKYALSPSWSFFGTSRNAPSQGGWRALRDDTKMAA